MKPKLVLAQPATAVGGQAGKPQAGGLAQAHPDTDEQERQREGEGQGGPHGEQCPGVLGGQRLAEKRLRPACPVCLLPQGTLVYSGNSAPCRRTVISILHSYCARDLLAKEMEMKIAGGNFSKSKLLEELQKARWALFQCSSPSCLLRGC